MGQPPITTSKTSSQFSILLSFLFSNPWPEPPCNACPPWSPRDFFEDGDFSLMGPSAKPPRAASYPPLPPVSASEHSDYSSRQCSVLPAMGWASHFASLGVSVLMNSFSCIASSLCSSHPTSSWSRCWRGTKTTALQPTMTSGKTTESPEPGIGLCSR